MFVFQCCTSLTSTKILRQVRPYRHILGMLAGGLLLLTAVLRLTNLKGVSGANDPDYLLLSKHYLSQVYKNEAVP